MIENNYFTRFSLPVKFEVNLDELEAKYLQLQIEFHPDKISDSNHANDSLEINEAYKVLKNPISRAAYILKLNNYNIDQDFGKIKPDEKTLEKTLSLQETIQETDNEEKILELKKYVENEIKNILDRVSQHLSKKEFEKAALLTIEVKYLEKSRLLLKSRQKFI